MVAATVPLLTSIGPTTIGTGIAASTAGSFIGPVTAAQSAAATTSLLQTAFTGLGVLGAISGGFSESNAYKLEAKQQELAARAEEVKGRQQAIAVQDKLRRVLASQNAAFAARGISAQSGTPIVLGNQSIAQARNDLDIARFDSASAVTGYKLQASQSRSAASRAKVSGFIKAGSLL